ncbi:Ribonuclease VapC [Syntrophobacter sp. SbD1]|nr:Ribonuclease VapC [Syntrophobacter sp. SbD1]
MIGLDTGFFVELLRGRLDAIEIWRQLVEGEKEAVVSCLTLFELERLSLKGAISGSEILIEGIEAVCSILWIGTPELPSQAARLSHGLGIPAFDSLILASFLAADITAVYTTDSHLESYREKGVNIIRI